MPRMLGSSRTIPWKLCRCRQCRVRREKPGRSSWFAMVKRSARGREERMWRREEGR